MWLIVAIWNGLYKKVKRVGLIFCIFVCMGTVRYPHGLTVTRCSLSCCGPGATAAVLMRDAQAGQAQHYIDIDHAKAMPLESVQLDSSLLLYPQTR